MGNTKRAILFSLYILPFMLNIALIDFLIPLKYDVILENLPFLGLLITIAWLASSFLDFAVGDLTDRIGVRKTIQLGILLSFIGSLIFGFSQTFLLMTIGVFIWGLSYIMLTVPSDTYLFSRFPRNYRGSAYGWMYFFYGLAYAIAPLICLALIYFFNINSAIIASSFVVIFSLPLSFCILGKDKEGTIKGVEDVVYRDGIILKELRDIKKMNLKEISLLFNMFICGVFFMTIIFAAPLLFFHEQRNLFHASMLTFAFMLPFAFSDLILGKFANLQKSRSIMIKLGFILAVLFLLIFFFVNNFIILFVLAMIITLTANMAWTASEIEVSEYLPRNKKGEFMGIFVTGKDLGFDLAPLFYGLIASIGLKIPFLMLGIMLLAALILFMIANRKFKYNPL